MTHTPKMLFVCGALALALAAGCSGDVPDAPTKPASVPAEAVWVGGAEGGVFIELVSAGSGPDQHYRVRVFHESGELLDEGSFVLDADAARRARLVSVDDVVGWDGERLLLEGGGALVKRGAAP